QNCINITFSLRFWNLLQIPRPFLLLLTLMLLLSDCFCFTCFQNSSTDPVISVVTGIHFSGPGRIICIMLSACATLDPSKHCLSACLRLLRQTPETLFVCLFAFATPN